MPYERAQKCERAHKRLYVLDACFRLEFEMAISESKRNNNGNNKKWW